MTNDKQTTTEGAAIYVQRLVIMAVFVAMTFVVTTYINVRIPFLAANGGLVHLGNVPVFVAAAVFGKKEGAVTGAFGLGLFDLLNGWVAWAPFTFVICGLIGFTYGLITKGKYETRGISFQIAAVVAAVVIKVVGYYIAEVIIYHNLFAPVASIPGNLVQIGTAAVIVLICVEQLRKVLRPILK